MCSPIWTIRHKSEVEIPSSVEINEGEASRRMSKIVRFNRQFIHHKRYPIGVNLGAFLHEVKGHFRRGNDKCRLGWKIQEDNIPYR